MATRTRKPSAVRRREIAEGALRVIGREGATSLTAATLAAEVGLTPGALFRHFASVDRILEAAVELAVERIDGTFPAAELPPLERLRSLARARVELVRGTPGLAWLLLSDQVYLSVPEPAVARLRDLVQRSRAFILAAFSEALERGELRADLTPQTFLPIFTGTIHSLLAAPGVHSAPGDSKPGGATSPTPSQVLDTLFTLITPNGSTTPS